MGGHGYSLKHEEALLGEGTCIHVFYLNFLEPFMLQIGMVQMLLSESCLSSED